MSGILENFEISRTDITVKYYVQVMPLFVYNGSRKIVGDPEETLISLRLEKQTQSAFVTIFYVNEKRND